MSNGNTTSPETEQHSISQLQIILGVLFGVSIITANVTAAKLAYFDLPVIGGVAVPAGFIAIAFAFLCSDLMAEIYGKDYAHKVVNATVISLGIAWALIWAAIYLPAAPFFEAHDAYVLTLGSGSGIIIASIVTVLIAQHIDITVFHRIKDATGDKHRWARNLGSTSLSQLVDTIIFITLAFAVFPTFFTGDPVYGMALLSLIAGQYIVKLGVALLDTPVFYFITSVRQWRETDSKGGKPTGTVRAGD